jgi:TRAP transporter TAXI family solute receptor
LAHLKGRNIAVGPPGSGTAVTSELLLRAFGIRLDQVNQHSLPFAELTHALTDGDLECAFVVSADPVDAVSSATAAGARLLSVSGPTINRLRAAYPFLRSTVIPGGLYRGHTDPVETVADDVLLVCRATMDELLVRRLTAALFEVLPQLALSLDYVRLMDIERSPATPIPLHPGAGWYYREAQLER